MPQRLSLSCFRRVLGCLRQFRFFFMQNFAWLGMRVCKTAVAAVLLKQGIDGECDQEKSTDR